MKQITLLLLLSIITTVTSGFAKSIINTTSALADDFVCPGMPEATYTYTENGWIDSSGNSISQPETFRSTETINILADYEGEIIGEDITQTFYIGPGATFRGNLPKIVNATVIVEGTFEQLVPKNSDNTDFYICSTGSIVFNIDSYSIDAGNHYHNAGNLIFSGFLNTNTGSEITNYSGGNIMVEGTSPTFSMQINSTLTNYGKIYVNDGSIYLNSTSQVSNVCTLYTKKDIVIDTEFFNSGLLLIEGTLELDTGRIINSGIADFGHLVVDDSMSTSPTFEGDGVNSLIVIRESAIIRNGATVSQTKYFDLNNGGGFDDVCQTCTEEITILTSLEIPDTETYINECGAEINIQNGIVNGTVYNDTNENGTQDTDELGLENVSVIITGADDVVQTVVTDINGNWNATSVIGQTQINIDESTLPSGAVQTEGDNPTTVTILENLNVSGGTDGYSIPLGAGTASGIVYEDTNENGAQDAGELGLENVIISITDAEGVTQTVNTDASGNWQATLVVGQAEITVIETSLPSSAVQTEGDNPTIITIVNATNVDGGSDGYNIPLATGTASGFVYEDTNENGTQDTDELGLENVIISITDAEGVTQTVNTDASGNWQATVTVGQAEVTISEISLPTRAFQTEGDNPTTITILENTNVDGGTDGYRIPLPRGTVNGFVYEDTNGNGTQDAGELGLENISILITDADGTLRTETTDADGNWESTIIVGQAEISVEESTLPSGAVLTEGSNPTIITIIETTTIDGGIYGYNIDTTPIATGTVSGLIYEDANENGVQETEELGIANISILITDAEGLVQTVITDTDGNWNASLIVGQTTINIDQSTLPDDAIQTQGSNPTVVTIVEAENVNGGTDGYYIPLQLGTVNGLVYEDANENGAQDPGEFGIEDVSISIIDAEGLIQTTTTDTDGTWSAAVIEGEAVIRVDEDTLPSESFQTEGDNPTVLVIIGGTNVNGGTDGFAIENDDLSESAEVVIYNAISPNDDGINDEMVISGIEFYSRSSLMIFNRWYQKIFEISDCGRDDNVFKGYGNNGEVIPSGTYTYILEYYDELDTQKEIVKSGHLYIER